MELRVDTAELAGPILAVALLDLDAAHRERRRVVRMAPNPSWRASASRSISRSISTPYTRCMQPMYVCPNSSYAYMKGHTYIGCM